VKTQELKNSFDCPAREISPYLDGELAPDAELLLESHIAGCSTCLAELNEQKSFLQALAFSLENDADIDLPANFTKTIVTNAESSVSGLRAGTERLHAIIVIGALLVFVVFILGSDTAFAPVSAVIDQTGAVLGFFGSLAFNFVFGTTVILRSAAAHIVAVPAGLTILFASVFAFFALVVSRRYLRQDRT